VHHEAGFDLQPKVNKGREALVYLTFIIDHYHNLPSLTAFVHADWDQWHNDVLSHLEYILPSLRLTHLYKSGYTNLRCQHIPGCPIAVNPKNPTQQDIRKHDVRAYFADIYMEIFDVPYSEVPDSIGNVCCAQFVVTRDRILERPLSDYVRVRDWIINSRTSSFAIGWTMEKIWHILFLESPILYVTTRSLRLQNTNTLLDVLTRSNADAISMAGVAHSQTAR